MTSASSCHALIIHSFISAELVVRSEDDLRSNYSRSPLLPLVTIYLSPSPYSSLLREHDVRIYHLKYQGGARDPQVPPATQLAMRPPRLIASHHPKLYHGEIPSQRLALVLHHHALGPNSGTQQAKLEDEASHSSSPPGALVASTHQKIPPSRTDQPKVPDLASLVADAWMRCYAARSSAHSSLW